MLTFLDNIILRILGHIRCYLAIARCFLKTLPNNIYHLIMCGLQAVICTDVLNIVCN